MHCSGRSAATNSAIGSHPRCRFRLAFTLVELLVVVSVIGILIAMLLPAVGQIREAARRIGCSNNLRQLSVAVSNYHSSNFKFPPGSVIGQGAGWSAFILEQIDQGPLARSIDLTDRSGAANGSGTAAHWLDRNIPGDGGLNEQACEQILSVFRCGSDPVSDQIPSGNTLGVTIEARYASSYMGVATGTQKTSSFLYARPSGGAPRREIAKQSRNGLLAPTQPAAYYGISRLPTKVRQSDVKDGLSNTVLIGEGVFDTSRLVNESGDDVNRGVDHWIIGSPENDFGQDMSEFLGSTAIEINMYHQWSDARLKPLSESTLRKRFSEMAFGFASWHAENLVNFAMGDGSVRVVESKIDPQVYSNLGNFRDGQLIEDF